MRGKMILVEGTDCSGKETQTNLLEKRLQDKGIKCVRFGFPDYNSPTGRIVGGPYLGKYHISEGFFSEGASNVDPKVSSMYYAADFLYHLKEMNNILDNGTCIILDRYFYSSFAHQGGKKEKKQDRMTMYKWLEDLFLNLCELNDPEIKVFLHMPYEVACELKKNRTELPDQNERDKNHLIMAENAYKEIASLYGFYTIECSDGNNPKKIEKINDELFDFVCSKINSKDKQKQNTKK